MRNLKENYSAPEIEIMEISVEAGIARSGGGEISSGNTSKIVYEPNENYHEL